MSAFQVSEAHITLLVEALRHYHVVGPEDGPPEQFGRALWCENVRSVNYRYQERRRMPVYDHAPTRRARIYTATGPQDLGRIADLVQDPVLVAKQVACYDYQSCEHPQYDTSWAAQKIAALDAVLLRILAVNPTELRALPAWDAAPWGIE